MQSRGKTWTRFMTLFLTTSFRRDIHVSSFAFCSILSSAFFSLSLSLCLRIFQNVSSCIFDISAADLNAIAMCFSIYF